MMLEVKNLRKNFGDIEVLKGINLKVEKNDRIAVIGPSGCGKSTFLKCLNMLEVPTSGEIIFEGSDITSKDINLSKIRQKIVKKEAKYRKNNKLI